MHLLLLLIAFYALSAQAQQCAFPNQTVCTTSPFPLPSWCKSTNPFQTVFSLSSANYPNVPCTGTECLNVTSDQNPFFCPDDSIDANCIDITSVITFETTTNLMPPWWNVSDAWQNFDGGNSSMQCSDNPKWCQPFVFMGFGTMNGFVLLNIVNWLLPDGKYNWREMQNVFVVPFYSKITSLATFARGPRAVMGVSGDLLKSPSSPDAEFAVAIYTLDTSEYFDTGRSIRIYSFVGEWTDARLVDFHITYLESENVWAIVCLSTKSLSVYSIQDWEGPLDPRRIFSDPMKILPLPYSVRWNLLSGSPLTILQSSVAAHFFNIPYDAIDNKEGLDTRTLIAVTTNATVSIFGYSYVNYTTPLTFAVDLDNATHPSRFFTPPLGYQISSAALFGERLRRFSSTSQPCSQLASPEAQPMWMVIAANPSDKSQSRLVLISVNEFTAAESVPDLYLNPANRRPGWPSCPETDFFNSNNVCQPRVAVDIDFTSPIVGLQVAYMDVPDAVLSFYSQLRPATVQCSPPSQKQTCQTQHPGDQAGFLACLDAANCKCLLPTASAIPQLNVFQNFAYHAIFAKVQGRIQGNLVVWGAQVDLCNASSLVVDLLDEHRFTGNLIDFKVSPNAMHVFAAFSRKRWELEGQRQNFEICQRLKVNPDDAFLARYKEDCDLYPPTRINHNNFGAYMSSCPSSLYCPSATKVAFPLDALPVKLPTSPSTPSLPQGYYAERPVEGSRCLPGFFCVSGSKNQCPIGYYCPVPQLSSPVRCPDSETPNQTCFHTNPWNQPGLIAPMPCQDGSMCIVEYQPGLPASPGYYLDTPSYTLRHCALGDYCNLGRSCVNGPCDLSCPSFFYCSSPDEVQPTQCLLPVQNVQVQPHPASFCPNGSFTELLCPAGNFCQLPNASSTCDKQQYCPEGSFSEEACPAGYFCDTPASKEICPFGSFCPEGSAQPRKCGPFTVCKEGTSSQSNNVAVPVSILLFFFGAWLAWVYYLRYRERLRKEREEKRKAAMARTGKLTRSSVELCVTSSEENSEIESLPSIDFTMDFSFQELGLKLLGSEKVVLAGVTGEIRRGHVTAVMGPSGAGKTTFLSTLCGKAAYGVTTGTILINGEARPVSDFKKIVGFVPQEDIMHRDLTVKENLTFSALSRLPVTTSWNEIRDKVNRTISILGLEEIRHSLIGDEANRGISGGQRKRVNIGLELVAGPTAIFLDEPTSGLDSAATKTVCKALRDIADLGICVVTVIHSPSYEAFRMFHDVLLLGKGGTTVYLGPSNAALDYFQKLGFVCPEFANPPDFFMDVIAGEVPRNGEKFDPSVLPRLWLEHRDTYTQPPEPIRKFEGEPWDRQTAGIHWQMLFFTVRSLIQTSRNWIGFLFDIGLCLLSGVFIGLIYFQQFFQGPPPPSVIDICPEFCVSGSDVSLCLLPKNDPISGEASFASLSLGLAGVAAALRVFGTERVVFWRESSTGISTFSYMMGKNIAHMPTKLFGPLLFSLMYAQMCTPRASLTINYIIFFGVYWTAAGYGYLVSIIAPPSQAQLIGVLSVLFNMMFSGQAPRFVQLESILGGVLLYPTYLSYIRWAEEAFYLAEVQHYQSIFEIKGAIDFFQYDLNRASLSIALVYLIGFVVRIATYIALQFLHKDKRV